MKAVIVLSIVVMLLGIVAIAYGASPPKATGGVRFMRYDEDDMEVLSFAEFQAHEGSGRRPAKGSIKFHDALGYEFSADVTCVAVWGNYATFSGPITKTNMEDWEGMWIQVWVHDGGTPGSAGDQIGGEFFDDEPECKPETKPEEWSPVIGGNLTVHP